MNKAVKTRPNIQHKTWPVLLLSWAATFSFVEYQNHAYAEEAPKATAAPKRDTKEGRYRGRVFEAFNVPDYQVDAVLAKKMSDEFNLLKTLSGSTKVPDKKADIYFRMAEILWLQERSTYFKKMETYDKEYEAYMTGKTKKKPVRPEFKGEAPFKLYKEIIRIAPNYSRQDEVLFLAGFHSMEKDDPSAEAYFQALVKKYPKSRFIYDAHMELGEFYFNTRKFDDAISHFAIVAKSPNRLKNFALYKISWCQYNKSDIPGATKIMQQVVKTSRGVPREIELREEALKDLIVFFSDMGQIDQAIAYFTSIGEPLYARKALERLSNIYWDQARYELAIATLRRLIALDPSHIDAPKHHARIIESLDKDQKLALSMREMQIFIAQYNQGSPWYSGVSDDSAREYAFTKSESYAQFLAKKYHEIAQSLEKTNPKESEKATLLALQFYQKYILAFPTHKNAYEMRFLYAELLYKTKRFDQAAEQYEAVIKLDPKGPKLKDSLLGVTDCLRQLEELAFKKNIAPTQVVAGTTNKSYTPIALSNYAERLISADTTFIKAFPKDDLIPKFAFERAQLYYNYNQFDKAKPLFAEVIQKFPSHSVANDSRHKILDIFNVEKDWVNLEKYATEFLKVKTFATPENTKLLMDLIQASIFARAEDLQQKKLHIDAAKTYERLFTKFPDSKFADKAMYNAAINYMNADQADAALALAHKFQAKYPKSDERPKLIQLLATYFDSQMDFEKAADQYEELVRINPKSELAPDALYNAGLYHEHLKNYAKALNLYQEYVTTYPRSKDAAETYFAQALIYKKLKNTKKAMEYFKDFPKKYGSNKERVVEAYYHLAELSLARRDEDEARTNYQRCSGLGKKYKVAMGYTAKCDFALIEPDLQDFLAIKLRMPQNVLMKAIDQKASLLQKVERRYVKLIELGDAEMGVASLHNIGLLYQDFSQALFKAPIPNGLSPEQKAQYQQELGNRAAPIEQKGVDAFEKAVQKAFELKVYSEWTTKSYDNISQYKPDLYPARQGKILDATFISEPYPAYNDKAGAIVKGNPIDATEFATLPATSAQNGMALRKMIDRNEGQITADPRRVDSYLQLGRAYRQIGDEEKSLAAFDNASIVKPNDTGLMHELAVNFVEQGEASKSLSHFKNLMSSKNPNWILDLEYAIALRKSGKSSQALPLVRKILALDKNNVFAMNTLALIYFDLKKFEVAELILNKTKKIYPTHAGTLNNLGVVHIALDLPELALRDFEEASKANSNVLQPWLNLGEIYIKHAHFTQAVQAYEQATKIDPVQRVALINLSAAYLGTKQNDKAAEAATSLVDANADDTYGLYNGGLAFLMLNDGIKAEHYWNNYIATMGSKIGKNHPAYGYLAQARMQIKESFEKEQSAQQPATSSQSDNKATKDAKEKGEKK